MSIKSKLSIALAFVAFSIGSAAFAGDLTGGSVTGIRSDIGSGSARAPLYYDARGGRHLGMIDSRARGRVASSDGLRALAQSVRSHRSAGLYDSETRDMLSPSSLDDAPDANSH